MFCGLFAAARLTAESATTPRYLADAKPSTSFWKRAWSWLASAAFSPAVAARASSSSSVRPLAATSSSSCLTSSFFALTRSETPSNSAIRSSTSSAPAVPATVTPVVNVRNAVDVATMPRRRRNDFEECMDSSVPLFMNDKPGSV